MPFAIPAQRIALESPLVQYDPDIRDYIRRVEAADGQPLEAGVRRALDTFVRGCKSDGIWDAIKASCVMMGARTLAGALTPLKGAAPTNNGPFVSGDYDRKTGLVGNETTKYLDSNRNNNADPQNSNHNAVLATAIAQGPFIGTTESAGGGSYMDLSGTNVRTQNRCSLLTSTGGPPLAGTLLATARSGSGGYDLRLNGSTTVIMQISQVPENNNTILYARNSASPALFSAQRLSFYSIGEFLDLALLDARVTALQRDIWNADTADSLYMTVNIAADGGTYTLRSTGTVNYAVDWGDGKREASTSNSLVHTYATAGQYQIRVISTAAWRFYNNNDATEGPKLLSVDNVTFTGTAIGTTLTNAWYGCSNLTSFSALPDTSEVTTFISAWQNCSSLTSFPALPDTSKVTNFSNAWVGCSSLTSFPALPDTSKVTTFSTAWAGCSNLTSFPVLPDTSQVTSFSNAWNGCSSLTSFPALPDTSKVTAFNGAWNGCSSLALFPSNQFDVTGTLLSNAFINAFANCALTAQSIENILTSLVTNGQNNITLTFSGGTNAGASTWTPAAIAAYDTLISRGWTIGRNA